MNCFSPWHDIGLRQSDKCQEEEEEFCTRPLQYLHRLQEGLQQGLACSFVGNHKKALLSANLIWVIKHLYDKATSAVLFNGSIGDWFRTTVGVQQGCLLSSILLNIFLDRCLRRSRRHCQHWRQNNHQSQLCWWHRWRSRRGRRTGKISWASQQSPHSLQHGNQCREDKADDKQH